MQAQLREYGKRKLYVNQGVLGTLQKFGTECVPKLPTQCKVKLMFSATNISLMFPQINVTTVREYLPEGDFSIMTEMLKKFLSFMNLTVSNFCCNFYGFIYKYDTLMTVEIKILWP